MEERERAMAYWLCGIPGVGDVTIRKLLEVYDSPVEIYQAPTETLSQVLSPAQLDNLIQSRQQWKIWDKYENLAKQKIGFFLQEDEGYPQRLKCIPDPPYALFVKGDLPKEDVLSVAVIGARDCSEYGRYVANGLGKALGECGVSVISGMARGIDGISQMAALEAGGVSYGVLGCGVDVCYPKGNRRLYEQLQETGGVVSAYVPGTQARAQNFPPRNRIVSGLADVVIVVEARNKSGTLITVDMALEQGKDVYVVPGRITDRLSDGCNKLLKQGAGIILSPDAFLEEIGAVCQGESACASLEDYRSEKLDAKQRAVYDVLDLSPQSRDTIADKVGNGYSYVEISKILMELCMMEMAVQVTVGHFRKS